MKVPNEDVVYYEYEVRFTLNIIKYIKQFIEIKKFYYRNIKTIKGNKIYLFNKNECVYIFDLFYRIREENNLIYHQFDPEIELVCKNKIKAILYKIYNTPIIKVKYKVYFENAFITVIDRYVLGKYYKDLEIKEEDKDSIINYINNKILILETDFYEIKLVPNKELFIRTSNEIFKCIKDIYLNDEIAIKPHPVFNKIYYQTADIKIYEDFIPVEYILDSNEYKVVIGGISLGLLYALKSNKKVISIINILNMNSEIKENYINWLQKESKGKILIPNNMEELRKYLLSYKNN
ncbi:hypothetical protein SAMN02745163_03353 [Clostridium cavendishii DSM 21758]|uniref:Uncharacterized protein n=2 Tax=Clostridium TaxID=1485 RepID=A0A1M6QC32_9CLOT|nr:hypothetical protein SAMN02745163_03353 [Clostridium cavendishii DSM 21758]